MKCPIPSEAKFSPAFQEVNPATVPLHSFCHTLLPIQSASERLRVKEYTTGAIKIRQRRIAATARVVRPVRCCLDECIVFISVDLPRPPNSTAVGTAPNPFL